MSSKQRTVVSMIVEWDGDHTSDPRKWDWNDIVGDEHSTVTHVGTRRLDVATTADDDDDLMRGIDSAIMRLIEEIQVFAPDTDTDI